MDGIRKFRTAFCLWNSLSWAISKKYLALVKHWKSRSGVGVFSISLMMDSFLSPLNTNDGFYMSHIPGPARGKDEEGTAARWPHVNPWRHINVKMTSPLRISANLGFSGRLFHVFPMLNALLSGWWSSLVMPIGDLRADFSIRPPDSWWILIVFDPLIHVCSKQIDGFINLTKRISFALDGNALLLPMLSLPGVTCWVFIDWIISPYIPELTRIVVKWRHINW